MSLHLLVVVHHQMVNVIGYILQISASVLAAALHCLGSLSRGYIYGKRGPWACGFKIKSSMLPPLKQTASVRLILLGGTRIVVGRRTLVLRGWRRSWGIVVSWWLVVPMPVDCN